MLDTDTKRRIDTARDILVGKVPDPKSQVEQITIALIYKFMDDMDAESEEFGGARRFFAGEYARYGWARLMHSGLGGYEILNLYAESIATMPENPGIPPLFRDIFKNAYLPYRDPETLRAFLKIIDEFTYDHSERLGDAFEYLLSVLSSQGDAGQFRTPRHIIDFMVEIVDPKKTDTVLDPACGTAGFLISAYKYILRENAELQIKNYKLGMENDGSPLNAENPEFLIRNSQFVINLTPDEKGRLARNFTGYDISPDMVRLSLVNMYLHGFADPHIYEYDTLTSQDRWNEMADVILANPPFMSPKGGIRPHNRFSVQSKRSEVLFVDYMAEHLTPAGRAGIIVPEGVIFQSGTAYRQLRKLLVEQYLVAVISLPAGVFNPYSGVKTSILILDKALAKKTDSIAFFRVENDGFGLGAQRREIEQNDLPEVLAAIKNYKLQITNEELRTADNSQFLISNSQFIIVPKAKIAENGEYNLSGERYREQTATATHWPLVELGKVARLINGRAYKQEELLDQGPTPVLRVGNFFSNRSWYYSDLELDDEKYCDEGDLLYAWSASFGPRIWEGPRAIYHYHIWKIETTDAIDKKFLFYLLEADSEKIKSEGHGIAMMHATKAGMEKRKFPLPPLDIQREIVAEIEAYQRVIDGARLVLDNYRPHIHVDPEWPLVVLKEVCDVRDGTHDSPKYVPEGYPLITSRNLRDGYIDFTDANLITRQDLDAINKRSKVDAGDILMPMIGTIGNPVIADVSREYAVKNVALIKFYEDSRIDNRFLKNVLASAEMQSQFDFQASGSTQRFISLGFIRSLRIPLPPLETQRAIVAEIEAEQRLVEGNRELIARFEQKIQAVLARIWNN